MICIHKRILPQKAHGEWNYGVSQGEPLVRKKGAMSRHGHDTLVSTRAGCIVDLMSVVECRLENKYGRKE